MTGYMPTVEQRIKIVYWLLDWAKTEGLHVWCCSEKLRIGTDWWESTPMTWYDAERRANLQQEEQKAAAKKIIRRQSNFKVAPANEKRKHKYSDAKGTK